MRNLDAHRLPPAQFAEAREEIDAAQESVGTTYFNEEVEAAREVVDGAVRDPAARSARHG